MKLFLTPILFITLFVLSGCSPEYVEKELRRVLEDDDFLGGALGCSFSHKYTYVYLEVIRERGLLTDEQINDAICGYAGIGMTENEVIIACGKPIDVNRTVTSSGVSEQWIYVDYENKYNTGRCSSYMYFDNGVLTATQS